jgi:Protein of unknown function (DUF4236)
MGFRFRRSVRILPGVKVNFSGSGASVSLGTRGLHYTIGPKGSRVTAGIPGTGLSWTAYSPHSKKPLIAPNGAFASPAPLALLPQETHVEELSAIQNASANEINALSTSELAPLLNSAASKFRFSTLVQAVSLLLFVGALLQMNQLWLGLAALYATTFVPLAVFLDRYRRSVKVAYDSQGAVARITEALAVSFKELTACKVVWTVQAEGGTADWKRNAGATTLNRREPTKLQFNKPSCIRGKDEFPTFKAGLDELYFLPDSALIVVNGAIAAISYRDLDFAYSVVRFIEDADVPSDSPVVDRTWQYVNKAGGPDRRFISNRQLPVCHYGELSFRSEGGLNCKFQLSNPAGADSFYKVVEALRRTTVDLPKSITYVRSAQQWPTITFLTCAIVLGIAQLSFVKSGVLTENRRGISPLAALNTNQAAPSAIASPHGDVGGSAPIRLNPPIELKPSASSVSPDRALSITEAESVQDPIDLSDMQNVRWAQARLRELGFLKGGSSTWDAASRSALRDFRVSNNIGNDDKWDYRTEELLASGSALPVGRTFIGTWSETACDVGSKPDLVINSRRAISSAGGVCEFSNIKYAGSSWSVGTACSNAGQKWSATIHLSVAADKLIWTGRDGTETQYARCR